jgi:hypothetical protein
MGKKKKAKFSNGASKRQPRRLLEAPPASWKDWDRAARMEGVSWAQFARRALLARVAYVDDLAANPDTRGVLNGLLERDAQIAARVSEKPPLKKRPAAAAKRSRARATGKGSSRS